MARATDAQLIAAYEDNGRDINAALTALGFVPTGRPRTRLKELVSTTLQSGRISIAVPPEEGLTVSELLEHRKAVFARKQAHEQARALIPVRIREDKPIGILHLGDPHVDDDGTDIATLERHLSIVRDTDGMYVANVGDSTNNWVGRLGRLYGEQSTSAREAWMLAEWMFQAGKGKWLYVIGGNHDAWSGSGDPLQWIVRQADAHYAPSEVRLALHIGDAERVITVNARHDFAGNSQYNSAHGPMKAALHGVKDDLLVCGHKHVSGYGMQKCPASGKISHCVVVASYKLYDRYAREKGFRDQHISPCVVTILDPWAADATGVVTVLPNVDMAVALLKTLRGSK